MMFGEWERDCPTAPIKVSFWLYSDWKEIERKDGEARPNSLKKWAFVDAAARNAEGVTAAEMSEFTPTKVVNSNQWKCETAMFAYDDPKLKEFRVSDILWVTS